MHTFGETGAGVPAFLAKLWRLVDDPETNNLICWSKDGRSFIIQNQAQFARELLPLNYKHNNMASFIRQLNMYGFHKITSIDNGGLKFDRDEMEFSHPCFKRNCPYLLEHIKRKIANTKTTEEKAALKPEAVSRVLQDVKVMRGRQDSLDSRFSLMKQENEALWREIASLRQKHAKQQQIVNKLIQFLITIVQPSRNMSGVKRHMQLMIDDTPDSENFRKTSESESECGPVIHELGEELLDEVADVDSNLMNPISPYSRSNATHHETGSPSPLHMERPQSSISVTSQSYDYSNQSMDDAMAQGQGNGSVAGTGAVNKSNRQNVSPNKSGASNATGASVIQAFSPDGSQIMYHVTEVPDAHPSEGEMPSANRTPNYGDENVLTTPMVREQMARSQLLKRRNKQQTDFGPIPSKNIRFSPQPQQQQQQQQEQQKQQSTQQKDDNLSVKIEPDIDPMLFLNAYDDNRGNTPNSQLISPNSNSGADASNKSATSNMYNTGDFISDNMPNDLFDDASLISGVGDNSNFSENFKLNGGKLSSFIAGSNANNNGKNDLNSETINKNGSENCASTSVAAGINSPMPSTSAAAVSSASTSGKGNAGKTLGKDDDQMAVTKYKNGNGPELREEVSGHIDSVQDELESLRELLRSDGYSLDTNTLMSLGQFGGTANNIAQYSLDTDFLTKLFNDSEVLGPYGLALYSDLPTNSNDKKGSELMSYQPVYDLSDILDKSDLEGDDNMNSPSSSRQPTSTQSSSVLNTPYHE